MSGEKKYRKPGKEKLFDYAWDQLSEQERYEVEQHLQRDPFDEEAAEGFELVSRQDAESDLAEATRYMNRRIRRRRRIAIYSAAAAVASLLIITTIFLNTDTGADRENKVRKMSEAAEKIDAPGTPSQAETEPASQQNDMQVPPSGEGAEPAARTPDSAHENTVAEKQSIPQTDKKESTARAQKSLERVKPGEEPAGFTEANRNAGKLMAPATTGNGSGQTGGEVSAAPEDEFSLDEDMEEVESIVIIHTVPDETAEPLVSGKEAEEAPVQYSRVKSNRSNSSGYDDISRYQVDKKGTASGVISGTVLSAEDGLPLPGVSLHVKGTSLGTVTDMEGNYRLDVAGVQDPTVVANFVGMEPKEVAASPSGNTDITLDPSASSLDEVVVVGYGTVKNSDQTGAVSEVNMNDTPEATYNRALPAEGLDAFRDYIDSVLVFPAVAFDSDRAIVILKFYITPAGRPTDIRAIRSPGDAFSREAIRVLENGPDWKPATSDGNYLDEEVRLRVVFER